MQNRWTVFTTTAVLALKICVSSQSPQPMPSDDALVAETQSTPLCDMEKLSPAPLELTSQNVSEGVKTYLQKIVLPGVKRNWYSIIPNVALPPVLKKACVVVQFKILKDGTVAEEKIVFSSGDVALDRAAFGGIFLTSPLSPLPADFTSDYVGLRFKFLYNPDYKKFSLPNDTSGSATSDKDVSPTPAEAERLIASASQFEGKQVPPDQGAPIIPGAPVHKVIPKYPKEARKAKLEGEVVVQATIEPNGDVNGVSIIDGDLKLAEEAVDAVRTWKFDPYSKNGKPVKVMQSIVFTFAHGKKQADLEPLPPPALANSAAQNLSKGGGVYKVGGGTSLPKIILSPPPEYSEKARRAKYQGACTLSLIVTPDGTTRDIKVVRALGKGLDEKAIEAVSKWKFAPATKDGKPVAVAINVEVMFHLY